MRLNHGRADQRTSQESFMQGIVFVTLSTCGRIPVPHGAHYNLIGIELQSKFSD
jgi:hypothetical protein